MGSICREWLGVISAEALTPAWAICYQRMARRYQRRALTPAWAICYQC
ncbi:MAG: hypothetical protein IKG23_13880 [Clostridia bacterium]|nr:hypothetical protein [Clostridia bacterium]